jgi:hypothetical protein
MKKHAPDCVLDPVHWFRHAVTAAGHLISEETSDDDKRYYDRVSAMALIGTLADIGEMSAWRAITLLEVAEHATLVHDDSRFPHHCTCGARR